MTLYGVKVNLAKPGQPEDWRWIRPTDGPPYAWAKRELADSWADICNRSAAYSGGRQWRVEEIDPNQPLTRMEV